MRQEQACCAFLTFEMHEEPDAVTLTIKAPEEARTTVDALFEPFLAAKEPSETLTIVGAPQQGQKKDQRRPSADCFSGVRNNRTRSRQ
jgi:hypothetical protein